MMSGGRINYLLQLDPWQREMLEISGLPEDSLDDAIEKMQARIDSFLMWANADRQMMKHALSAAIYGKTYAHGKLGVKRDKFWRPVNETTIEGRPDLQRWEKFERDTEYPKWTWVSTWDVFTDLEDDDLQTNAGSFVRWFTNKHDLSQVLVDKDPALLKENLRSYLRTCSDTSDSNVLKDSDGTNTLAPKYDSLEVTKKNSRLLEFIGKQPARNVMRFLVDRGTDEMRSLFDEIYADLFEAVDADEDFNPEIEIVATLVGPEKTLIRLAPVDPASSRNIFCAKWEDAVDDIDDTGVTDNTYDTQHLLDGIYRAIIDNQKLSGNVILGVKEELLLEGIKEVKPGTMIRVTPETQDVRQAIQPIVVPDVSAGLINAFNLTASMLEDDSAIPRIQQGQEPNRAETAFSISQRVSQSGKYFGQIVRNFDEGLVEPIVTWIYDFIMNDPEHFEGKGAYSVQALGFSSFQNKVTRLNSLMQFLNIALSHEGIYEALNLSSIFRELARMLDLDPDQIAFSPEELEARKAQEQQAQQAVMEMDTKQKEAAIARDESLATINNVSAQAKAEELRLKQLKAVDEMLTAEQPENIQ